MSAKAKGGVVPFLPGSREVKGAVTEGGAHMRESMTDPFPPTLRNIRHYMSALRDHTKTFFNSRGFHPVPVSVSAAAEPGARTVTDEPRYIEDHPDPEGRDHASETASIQISVSEIPDDDLLARFVGVLGDYAHMFTALSSSSRFIPRKFLPEYVEGQGDPDQMVDTGLASGRTLLLTKLMAFDIPRPYENMAQYESAEAQVLARYPPRDGEPVTDISFHYPLIRLRRAFMGAEIRLFDNVRTQEELDMFATLAVATAGRSIERLRDAPNNRPKQTSAEQRFDALADAATYGMADKDVNGEDREIWLPGMVEGMGIQGQPFDVIRRHLQNCREAMKKIDKETGNDQINEALRVVDRLEEIGTGAERDVKALAYYREVRGHEFSMDLRPDEEVYLQCFALAEERFGLFADQQALREKALQWQERAFDDALTPDFTNHDSLTLSAAG